MSRFDILILVGPKDQSIIQDQIQYTKQNILGYRNIYILSSDPTLELEGCISIQESVYPFSLETVEYFHGKRERNGWYLQQLLKLYAPFVIPGLLERFLVVDSDTFFLKPLEFFKDGIPLYNTSAEYHKPYFHHMKLLHPSFERVDAQLSGIAHHIIFEKEYIQEIFNLVEGYHKEHFYIVFLRTVDIHTLSGASEYELYFNYMCKTHRDKIQIRKLQHTDSSQGSSIHTTAAMLKEKYDYISFHWFLR
jgi:hypothetical protein